MGESRSNANTLGQARLSLASFVAKHAALAIAAAVAGHHCGLANYKEARRNDGRRLTPLVKRLKTATVPLETPAHLRESLSDVQSEQISSLSPSGDIGLSFSTRMLLSCLVDADSLVTEKFVTPESERFRRSSDSLTQLSDRLDKVIDRKCAESEPSLVNTERSDILSALRARAESDTGWFTLNVPTGGGKTLSSLSFALRHAARNGQGRVIVGIPFTSIIDQTATIYRDILGKDNVLEHHSNLDDFDDSGEGVSPEAFRARMSCEDWDRPVIVTTNVQLLETLFAHKRSRVRKAHRIARSVIVLDEMQGVPERVLAPVLAALDELVRSYGCTVIVCTATQPAIRRSRDFAFGIELSAERELAPPNLHQKDAFKRVTVRWPETPLRATPYDELSEEIAERPCSLAITHLKSDARTLFEGVASRSEGGSLFHLSTFMCPAHRKLVLRQIKGALEKFRKDGAPCRVISTQLVEAGVDLDFPVVFRALAGIDALVQAAGRCNREQKLPNSALGELVVFLAETEPPPGMLRNGLAIAKAMLAGNPALDIFHQETIRKYFEQLYANSDLDDRHILDESRRFNLETVGQEMLLIEEAPKTSIVITFDGTSRMRIDSARKKSGGGGSLRPLQTYTLPVFEWVAATLRPKLEPLFPESETLVLDTQIHSNLYTSEFGLALDATDAPIPPANLIADAGHP
ncbi:MAG: DEAD/DEAH box helicase [Verrucomicrobiales bacterium]